MPKNEKEEFFQLIFKCEQYKTINALCNATKHFDKKKITIAEVMYESNVDQWDNFDEIQNVDKGQPSAFTIDGVDIIVYIDNVLDFYKEEWFNKKT